MLRYNKKIQKRLNITLKDYELFYNIIIELIPISKEELKHEKNKFITTYDENYCHIFFNHDKKEVKQNYITNKDNISKITIKIERRVKVLASMFYFCSCIKEINFIEFKQGIIINTINMFYECQNLKKIDLTKFKTDKIKDMSFMFFNCHKLEQLNISNFNFNENINSKGMFLECSEQLINNIKIQNKNIKNETFYFRTVYQPKKLEFL